MYSWPNINGVLTSYLKNHDSPNMKLVDGLFLMPLISMSTSIMGTIGPVLEQKFKIKFVTILGTCSQMLGLYIISHTTKIINIYIGICLFGTCSGLSLMPLLKNFWAYYPSKKGLLTGVCFFGFGLSPLIYNSLSTNIINPKFEKADPVTGLFKKEIAENVKDYLNILNLFVDICAILVIITVYEYKENENEKKNVPLTESENKNNEDDDGDVKNPIQQVYSSIQVYQLIIMNICTFVFCYTVANTNRTFGQLHQIDESLLGNLANIYAIVSGCSRLIWGILFDKFGFKKLYILLLLVEIIDSATIYFSVSNPYLYCFQVCLGAFILAGNVSLIIPIYPKVFGLKYSTVIYGIATFFLSFGSMISPTLTKILVKEKEDYKYLFWASTCFSVVSLISCLSFKEEKFRYRKDKIDKEQELIEK